MFSFSSTLLQCPLTRLVKYSPNYHAHCPTCLFQPQLGSSCIASVVLHPVPAHTTVPVLFGPAAVLGEENLFMLVWCLYIVTAWDNRKPKQNKRSWHTLISPVHVHAGAAWEPGMQCWGLFVVNGMVGRFGELSVCRNRSAYSRIENTGMAHTEACL